MPVTCDFDSLPLLMTPNELAEVTHEHPSSIRRGITAGRIPADKVNGKWLISRDAVLPKARLAFVERHAAREPEARPSLQERQGKGAVAMAKVDGRLVAKLLLEEDLSVTRIARLMDVEIHDVSEAIEEWVQKEGRML